MFASTNVAHMAGLKAFLLSARVDFSLQVCFTDYSDKDKSSPRSMVGKNTFSIVSFGRSGTGKHLQSQEIRVEEPEKCYTR